MEVLILVRTQDGTVGPGRARPAGEGWRGEERTCHILTWNQCLREGFRQSRAALQIAPLPSSCLSESSPEKDGWVGWQRRGGLSGPDPGPTQPVFPAARLHPEACGADTGLGGGGGGGAEASSHLTAARAEPGNRHDHSFHAGQCVSHVVGAQ